MGINEKTRILNSFGRSDNNEKGPFEDMPYLQVINFMINVVECFEYT